MDSRKKLIAMSVGLIFGLIGTVSIAQAGSDSYGGGILRPTKTPRAIIDTFGRSTDTAVRGEAVEN